MRCKYCSAILRKGTTKKDLINNSKKISDNRNGLKKLFDAAVVLYLIGGAISLLALFLLLAVSKGGMFLVITITLFVFGGGFIGLAIWSNKKPYPALLTGLIVYSLLALAPFMGLPGIILPWFVHIAFFAMLFKGVNQALFKHKKELSRNEGILDEII